MISLSTKSVGRACRLTLGLLVLAGCCCDCVRAQTGNSYGLDPATVQNPFYTNTYSNNHNGYYNSNPSTAYYGNNPGYNNNNYNPASTIPPASVYLPANTAPPAAASTTGWGGEGDAESEDVVTSTGGATQTGYYSRHVIPASSGTRLPVYGDWNPPPNIGSVFAGGGRVGLLESRAPYYNYNNNNNNNNYNYNYNRNYGYAQQQQNSWNPFMAMMAFDVR